MKQIEIRSPKLVRREQDGWQGFFPYYAGFPESFAEGILKSAGLGAEALVLDPWNGSGTTTYAAAREDYRALGLDLNPVMVLVSKARLLPPSEADALLPLAERVIHASRQEIEIAANDPLLQWFTRSTGVAVRGLERAIRQCVVGGMTQAADGTHLENISCIAATLYAALFSVCRELVSKYRSTNPTWTKVPRHGERRRSKPRQLIEEAYRSRVRAMGQSLCALRNRPIDPACVDIRVRDSTHKLPPGTDADLVLTSPPYCTRLDYTAATRIELAVLFELVQVDPVALSREMIGSTRVPQVTLRAASEWGTTSSRFLDLVANHESKASRTYYLPTHLDYFDKMYRSLGVIADALKPKGIAILVAQDSYYKEVHNDLPTILTEMATSHSLILGRREDFKQGRTMSNVNPRAQKYARPQGAVESVLCFRKA
jgi:SAM-dependent methyltransferase